MLDVVTLVPYSIWRSRAGGSYTQIISRWSRRQKCTAYTNINIIHVIWGSPVQKEKMKSVPQPEPIDKCWSIAFTSRWRLIDSFDTGDWLEIQHHQVNYATSIQIFYEDTTATEDYTSTMEQNKLTNNKQTNKQALHKPSTTQAPTTISANRQWRSNTMLALTIRNHQQVPKSADKLCP